ncbi:hypothetical protein [Stieleria varia]|uniref:Uncharacterized protein n=1 Tax=Stieleria varia TaxID=2528005 RepID=A0A5C5ZVY9_9BACT|nr:hypothetical protein [Stieleria varia]TWT91752.1 hypothetical protein Pla52n_65020 [Stieleria varia]
MDDIEIHQCRLRVTRRGGWGWWASRRDLVESAVNVLPELIARRIALIIDVQGDLEITDTLRINITCSRSQWLRTLQQSSTGCVEDVVLEHLWERIDSAIRQSVLPEIDFVSSNTHDHSAPTQHPIIAEQSHRDEISDLTPRSSKQRFLAGLALLQLLIRWRLTEDRLWRILPHVSETTLQAWDAKMATLMQVPAEVLAGVDAGLSSHDAASPWQVIERLAHSLPPSLDDRATSLRFRIAAVIEAILQTGSSPGEEQVREALNHWFPIAQDAPPVGAIRGGGPKKIPDTDNHGDKESSSPILEHDENESRSSKTGTPEPDQSTTNQVNRVESISGSWNRSPKIQEPLHDREVYIASALPFLLLRPLSDLGYLDALRASLEAAELEQFSSAFAAALAYKVLDPPDRGWRRSPAARTAALTFAGLDDVVPDDAIYDLASQAGRFVSALNAVLTQAVLAGRESDQPLLLTRAQPHRTGGYFLADVGGMFPITVQTELQETLELLDHQESMLLLVESSAADPRLLAELNRRGLRFIIDAPPARGETWRAVKHRNGGRWWTNDVVTSSARLSRQAKKLPDAAHAAEEYFDAFASSRLAIPNSHERLLENSLTQAAGVALAQIAWDLWQQREATDPLLTLQRFADFDANVQFTDTEVRVRLPLGRRWMDLSENGLLQDVIDVPWLDDRTVTFSKG